MKKGLIISLSVVLSCIIALLGINFCFGDFLKIKLSSRNKQTVQAQNLSTLCPYDIKLCFIPINEEEKPATFGVDEDFIQFEYFADTGETVFSSADWVDGFYKSTYYNCFLVVNGEEVNEFEAILTFTDDYIFSYLEAYPFDELIAPSYPELRRVLFFGKNTYFLTASEHFLNFWATYEAQYATYGPVSNVYWDSTFEDNVDNYFRKYYKGENVFDLSVSFYYSGEFYRQSLLFSLSNNYLASHNFE